MIKHYNAFISYKHADLDNKVAATIQRSLEHYKIPGKLRRKTGKKRIERVFRDKDELPITSNLSDDISYALEHADYLIVICSTNTRKSIWVEREIQFFLQNHSMNQILTVLADGEPQDVIPEILLSEEKTITDENGNEQVVRLPLEPLSCDWRLPERKAKREELPRLAATLIGCSYDELMNRQRQYKMQRLTAIFALIVALALGFGAYMAYSRTLIQKNYIEALRNQSMFLANQSKNEMLDSHRMTALQLALEALPKDEKDERPVTPEAVRALTDATLAYQGSSGNDPGPAWDYRMPKGVTGFEVSEDGAKLAATDLGNNIKLWDTATHKEILSLQSDDVGPAVGFAGSDYFLVRGYHVLTAYDVTDGKEVWQLESDHYFSGKKILTPDGSTIMLYGGDGQLEMVDAKTGEIKKTYTIATRFDGDVHCAELEISPDGTRVAYRLSVGLGDEYAYGVMDFATEEFVESETTDSFVQSLTWADDKHLCLSLSDSEFDSSSAFGTQSIITKDLTTVRCVDGYDLSTIWEHEITCTDVQYEEGFLPLPTANAVAYYAANLCEIYDIDSGEVLHSYDANDPILSCTDNGNTGEPSMITNSGRWCIPYDLNGKDALGTSQFLPTNLVRARVRKGLYVQDYQGKVVRYYQADMYDPEFTPVENSVVMGAILRNYSVMTEDAIAIITDQEQGATLTIVDPNTAEIKKQLLLGTSENQAYEYQNLEIKDGKVYMTTDVRRTELTVDLQDYHIETRELTQEEQDALHDKEYEPSKEEEFFETLDKASTYAPVGSEFHEMQDGTELYLAILNDGSISRYDRKTKQFLGNTDIMIGGTSSIDNEVVFQWDEENHMLYVNVNHYLSIVDTDTWMCLGYVPYCLGYHKGTDRFYTFFGYYRECQLGYYRHYTLDELKQKALDYLQGAELTPAEKSMYGITSDTQTEE